ncbi:MAG TPA: HAMP domain-containing sensor histidine kinase [Nocardioides sp.]|uniref:sensor histidine kinase n=1 Tax=Nocardioides sp. TaxID=35761 RepID=UPI002D7EAF59|nr:HAMP domain-containing sensor histidine kinase [Nocardioides sp.]HET6652212.1 HAMP domain-containing sensor histidine kinase [Nocardioides sp.]
MRRNLNLFVPWLFWGTACAVAMWFVPGRETVPYHLGYAGLAVAFGLDVWSTRRTYVTLAVYTVITGVILLMRAADGHIHWAQTTEIPFMTLLLGLMIWHVGHRDAALRVNREMAERDREQVARRERLVRLTSHEMRTPLTIMAGYVDLLRSTETGPVLNDLDVVREEIDRLDRACDRLLRMIRFHDDLPQQQVDLDRLMQDIVDRWSIVAPRDWQVTSAAGVVDTHEERVKVCVDTLVENAVRYTEEGDTIRVFARREGAGMSLGVADSGSGFSPEQVAAFNGPQDLVADASSNQDPRARTGLGLSLVREIVESRQGRLEAGVAPEGGALVTLTLPISDRSPVRAEPPRSVAVAEPAEPALR